MSDAVTLTTKGFKEAMGLLFEHCDRRGLAVPPREPEPRDLVKILMAQSAMTLEARTQAWFEAQMDRILGIK